MIAWWNSLCLTVGDSLLGWSLRLPSDVTLLIVSVLSATVFTLVRLVTTDQDRLRRAAADKRQLRRLIREAKSRRDRQSVARRRATRGQIGLLSLRAELWPLLAAIGPIALLATWCALRLEFHPPRHCEPVTLAVYTPVSATGKLVHLVPQDGVKSDGWIKGIEPITDDGPPYGMATWQLEAEASPQPYDLTVRYRGEGLRHELLIGRPKYSPSLVQHGEAIVSELQYERVKLFGRLPGIATLYCPPWLTAYLVLSIPLIFVIRRLLRIR